MATRYYTEEAYEQIRQTIEQIDSADVNPVMDFFSDLFRRLAQYLKFYSVDDYQNDMQTWYNKVLNSHDTTLSEVTKIFGAVESVDFEYRDIMDGALDSITNFRSTLNCLRDVISGKTNLSDGKAAADSYLAAGKNSLNSAYDTVLTKMEQTTLWNASKELFGDALKLGTGFMGLLIPTTPAKYGVKCKEFIDTFTATLGDLGAVGSIILLPPITVATKTVCSWFGTEVSYDNYLDTRFDQLMQAQDYKDTNSVSDWLGGIAEDMDETLTDCPDSNPYYSIVKSAADGSRIVSNTADGVDMVADLYDIGSGLKDSYTTVDEWLHGKNYTVDEYMKVFEKESPWKSIYYIDSDSGPMINVRTSPGDIISKLFSDRTGIPFSGWTDPSKFDGNILKTAGTLWSYTETILSDPSNGATGGKDWMDVFVGKIKDVGTVKEVIDFARDNLLIEVS